MKNEKGQLCPFNKLLLILFERSLVKVNYSKEGIYSLKTTAEEHLFYLENNKITVSTVKSKEIKDYFIYLKTEKKVSKNELILTKSALTIFYTFLAMPYKLGITVPKFPKI